MTSRESAPVRSAIVDAQRFADGSHVRERAFSDVSIVERR
jgi:hypothetical protein